MTPLTVVHVETGRHLYGGALQVYYLLRGLTARGVRNVLVCPEGSAIAQAAAGVAEVRTLPMRGELDLAFIGRLRRLLRAEPSALLHLHSRRGADLFGGIAGRLEHRPAVLTRRVDNPEARLAAQLKYRLYDRVITISEGIRKVLLSEGVPEAKLYCVRSAVDTEKFRPGCRWDRMREAFELDADALVVGMAAQFIERKGHRCLLDAVPTVVGASPRARFLLLGRGPLEPALRQEVQQRHLADKVRFAGFREDLERILPCIDLLVHPAEMEGLGVALLQAASCGVPIVATAAGGIPEIVRDGVNGLLVRPRDPSALAGAMVRLLSDREARQRLGAAGRRIVEDEFSIRAMVEGNLRVYDRLLDEGRQRSKRTR